MKFRYLGDKEFMVAFGYDFSNGAEPDVTDDNAIVKLSGNSHFEAIEETTGGTQRPNVRTLLLTVQMLETVGELDKLAEGEDRKTVLDAIAKKKAQLLV